MSGARWLLTFSALAWSTLGCGASPADGELGAWREPVIAGEVDTTEANAAVVVVKNRFDEPATGVLVAPTLVLTSRHFLFATESDEKERFFLNCAAGPDGKLVGQPVHGAYNPADYFVGTGSQTLKVVRLFAGSELDLCANDLVLLQLERAVRAIAPLPLRLDEPPRLGERGWLVGWGMTEQSDDVMTGQGLVISDRRMRRAIDVRAVGETVFEPPGGEPLTVPAGMFLAPPSGCYGDHGAPFIAETGAVIGILSNIAARSTDPNALETPRDCRFSPAYFRSLSAQRSWLEDAFERAGEVPRLEHLAAPAALAIPCRDGRECLSGLCLATASGHAFCSRSCEIEACPDELECLGERGARLCLPARLSVGVHASRGCATAVARPFDSASQAALLITALALVRWRRRSQRNATDTVKEIS